MPRDARGGYNRKTVNERFFKLWSPKMAYVLGFMFADGSLVDSNSSSRTYYISFTNNDYYVLNAIREAMKSEHKIYKTASRTIVRRGNNYVSKPGYVFRIGNKKMYDDLIYLGVKHRKSHDMLLPDIPQQYFRFFLRGYFDGDGCINIYLAKGRASPGVSVIYTSGSQVFLQQLSQYIATVLKINRPNYYKSTGAFNLTSKGSSAIKILDYMYEELNKAPYLRRKYLKYFDFVANMIGPRLSGKRRG